MGIGLEPAIGVVEIDMRHFAAQDPGRRLAEGSFVVWDPASESQSGENEEPDDQQYPGQHGVVQEATPC